MLKAVISQIFHWLNCDLGLLGTVVFIYNVILLNIGNHLYYITYYITFYDAIHSAKSTPDTTHPPIPVVLYILLQVLYSFNVISGRSPAVQMRCMRNTTCFLVAVTGALVIFSYTYNYWFYSHMLYSQASDRTDTDHRHQGISDTVQQRAVGISHDKPGYTWMNISALNASGIYPDPIPEYLYYRKQPTPVNSWTFGILRHNISLCNHGDSQEVGVRVCVLVISAPDHVVERDAVRDTWGGLMTSMAGVRMNFVLGRSLDQRRMAQIHDEANMYDDIILFDFIDAYEQLTIKSMMLLTWANRFCSNVDFIVKVDDDMLLNVYALIANLLVHKENGSHHIIGNDSGERLVNPDNEWVLPHIQFPFKMVPSFMTGPIYALTSHATSRIAETSRYVPILRLEDVYVTGVVRKVAGLAATHDGAWGCMRRGRKTHRVLVRGEVIGVHHTWMYRRRLVHNHIELHQFRQTNKVNQEDY